MRCHSAESHAAIYRLAAKALTMPEAMRKCRYLLRLSIYEAALLSCHRVAKPLNIIAGLQQCDKWPAWRVSSFAH